MLMWVPLSLKERKKKTRRSHEGRPVAALHQRIYSFVPARVATTGAVLLQHCTWSDLTHGFLFLYDTHCTCRLCHGITREPFSSSDFWRLADIAKTVFQRGKRTCMSLPTYMRCCCCDAGFVRSLPPRSVSAGRWVRQQMTIMLRYA
jgi:hypothetical protein